MSSNPLTKTLDNGKGDAPRNMGPLFRQNYDSIFRKKQPTRGKRQLGLRRTKVK